MPDESTPPRLPRSAPAELRQFVTCTIDRVELDLADMGWIPKPDLPGDLEDRVTPGASVLDGWTPRTATIRVGYGDFISIELPASIVDGELRIDAANIGFGIGPEIDKWVDAFNRTLRANDKQLDTLDVRNGKVVLTKRAIPATGTDGAAVAPVTTAQPTTPSTPPDDGGKKKTGCLAWLAATAAAIAVAIGVVVATSGDDDKDAITTGDSVPAASTSTPASTSTSTSTTSTTLAEVGQVPPPTDGGPTQSVCGTFGDDPAARSFWSDPAATVDPAQQAVLISGWSDALGSDNCVPGGTGYGGCDPVVLPCSSGTDIPLFVAVGTPGIDHSRTVPDAVTGEESASVAEQPVYIGYLGADGIDVLARITSDCGGNIVIGEALAPPNDVTVVDQPLRTFGPCTITDLELAAADEIAAGGVDFLDPESVARAAANVRGRTYLVNTQEPDAVAPPVNDLALTRFRAEIDADWNESALTLGNTFGLRPATADCIGFFEPTNIELIIEVLDGCTTSDPVWVFYAATTNVEFELTVTDTVLATAGHYANPLGEAAPAVTDTAAFATSAPYFDNTVYPCGYGHVAYTACPEGAGPMDAGAFVTVTGIMLDDIPIEGDGTDRMHRIDFAAAGGPAYTVAQYTDGWTVASTAGTTRARALLRDDALMLVAPHDELPAGELAYVWSTIVDGQTVTQPAVPVAGMITTPPFPAEPDGATPPSPTTTAPPADAEPPTDDAAPEETLDEFYAALSASVSSGDLGFSLARLHPTVLEAYPTECPAALSSFADPDLVIAFVSDDGPDPWIWELSDGRTFDVPDAITVTIALSGRGQSGANSPAHVAVVDGQYRWFTLCDGA